MVSHQAIGIYYKFILSDVAFLINYVRVKNVMGKCCLI